jgi:putative hydrolase of the HAD superfamily
MISAVLFDFGGVILSSPFEAFRAYEERAGLPVDIIRTINSTDPDANAWARLERSEIDVATFVAEFEREAAALGHRVDGTEVISCLRGELRPEMVEAVRRCKERHDVALLTNNIVSMAASDLDGGAGASRFAEALATFDVIVESSKVGVRKPDPRFYELACELAGVDPARVVFLDDLGINLKPARAMRMTTIKVGADYTVAIREVEQLLGLTPA